MAITTSPGRTSAAPRGALDAASTRAAPELPLAEALDTPLGPSRAAHFLAPARVPRVAPEARSALGGELSRRLYSARLGAPGRAMTADHAERAAERRARPAGVEPTMTADRAERVIEGRARPAGVEPTMTADHAERVIEGPAPSPPPSPLASVTADRATWLRQPMRGPEVAELQRQLRAAGFDPGPIDGYMGPVTERAVRAYQASRGLVVDGLVGPQTVGALTSGAAPVAARPAGPPSATPTTTPAGPGATPGAAPTGPVAEAGGPVPPTIEGMLAWADTQLGTPYASVNPFRFGDVPWDGQPHKSVNGSGTVWNYPAGTKVYDCSGFVVAAYRQIGVDLAQWNATSSGNIANSRHLQDVPPDQLRPGDLITYASKNGVGHVVIYLGEGRTIEASGSKGVTYGTVDWSRANAFKRVPLPNA
jgi:peptidoglycan hydrolase-like protein with peptidoglycan-binding domain